MRLIDSARAAAVVVFLACLGAVAARADHDFAWAVLHDSGASHGSSQPSDWQAMARLGEKGVRDGLYARLGKRRFLIADSAVRTEVLALLEPPQAIERQQAAVGREMTRLAMERATLETRRQELERREDEIADHIEGLRRYQSSIGRSASNQRLHEDYDRRIAAGQAEREKVAAALRDLRPRLAFFDAEDRRLSRHHEGLDREHEKMEQAAEREIREVIEGAIDRGLGRPLPG